MQTIKLRQTIENNGGPFTLKNEGKGVPKMVLTKLQYVMSWDETVLN